MRLIFGASAGSTMAPTSIWRLRLAGLEVRMWREKARPRLILPPAVFLKRLAAPLWVFSFGIFLPSKIIYCACGPSKIIYCACGADEADDAGGGACGFGGLGALPVFFG